LALIRRIPLIQMAPVLQRAAIWMVIVSVVSAFFLQTIEFPVGGVFGRAIALWLQNLLGIVGTLALLLFLLLATFVYSNNPNLDDFTWYKLLYETRQAWRDLLNGNYGKRRPVAAPPPRNRTRSVPAEETETELPELELPIQAPEAETAPGSQLSFDLTKRSALFEDGSSGDKKSPGGPAELEINMPVQPEPPITPDEAPVYKPPVELVQEDTPQLSEPYDPTLELSHYEYPHLQLLNEYDQQTLEVDREELEANKNQIIQTLLYFKIEIEKIRATIGPTVTLYEIIPARGIRISKIKNLEDDIALNLSALGIRII
jgi:S-DNA-T family DNA segregation ATPase FtsK/SpoIIIE